MIAEHYISYFLSPLGTIELKATEKELYSLLFVEKIFVEKPNAVTKLAISQLEEYFSKKRTTFELPLSQNGSEFQLAIWDAIKSIPFGRTISYKELSIKSGKMGNARAVGSACGQNQLLIVLPCHRVIATDGNLTGYAGELWRKKWLIDFEQADKKTGQQLGLIY